MDKQRHYKMYKKGKHWLIAGVVTTAVLAGSTVLAQADAPATASEPASTPATVTTDQPDTTSQVELKADSTVPDSEAPPAASTESEVAASASDEQAVDEAENSNSEAPVTDSSATTAPSDSTGTAAPTPDEQDSTVTAPTTDNVTSDATTDSDVSTADPATPPTTVTPPPAEPTPVVTVPESKVTVKPVATKTVAKPAALKARATVLSMDDEDINVWMPDKNLQQVMLQIFTKKYGITTVDQITKAMVAEMETLSVDRNLQDSSKVYLDYVLGVKSLDGLEYATSMKSIYLTPDLGAVYAHYGKAVHGSLTDIDALAGLENLRSVNLQSNSLKDVSALATLQLTDLSISYNAITDVSPLQHLDVSLLGRTNIGYQQVFLPTITINPKNGSYIMPSFIVKNLTGENVSINPEGYVPALGASSSATGTSLDATTIEWTDFTANEGYLLMTWADSWLGNNDNFPYDGYIILPFVIDESIGNISVNYMMENGTVLVPSLTLSGKLGDTYDLSTLAEVQDQVAALKARHLELVRVDGNETWTASETPASLTYVFRQEQVAFKVHAQDESGQTIATFPATEIAGNHGEVWTYLVPELAGYTFKKATQGDQDLTPVSRSTSFTGQFATGDADVYLTYTAQVVTATVTYVYKDGTTAAPSVQLTGQYGDVIDFPKSPDIANYQASALPTDATYTDGDNQYTVVYTEIGQVTVRYVDEQDQVLMPAKQLSGLVDEAYTTTPPNIAGYTLKTVPTNASGLYTSQPITVTYVYTKDPVAGQPVTATYEDEQGQLIADTITLTGNLDDPYTTSAKSIAGYTFKLVNGNPTGTFTDQAQTVRYVYTKDAVAGGVITVQYVDEQGHPLVADEKLTGDVDAAYVTTAKTIAGYTLKTTPANASGTFTTQPQTVTYVYVKTPAAADATVTVTYVDEAGNQLAAADTQTGKVGETYTTSPKTIAGYTLNRVQGQPTGVYTTATQTVTYIYTKDPVQMGTVTVQYVDQNGQPISASETLTGAVGSDYITLEKQFANYTLRRVDGQAQGQFTTDNQVVTYVYELQADTITPEVPGGNTDGDGTEAPAPEPSEPEDPSDSTGSTKPETSETPQTEAAGATINPANTNTPATGQAAKISLQPVAQSADKSEAESSTKAALPQTNAQASNWLTRVGVGLLSLVTLGWFGIKRRL